MGQKAHPYGLRVGYIKNWRSRWFAGRNHEYIQQLHEDLAIRQHIKKNWNHAGISEIEIERFSKKLRVTIHTARPGVIIGRRGAEIDRLRDEVGDLTKSEVFIDIKEIKLPQADAQLVAENITLQLEKRVSFRRAMKRAVQLAMSNGALGIKLQCAGRLGGGEIARTEGYKEGKVPLSTFRADIDYGFAEAFTTYGIIGCKVWVYKGEVLVKQKEAERAQELVQREKELARHQEGVPKVEGDTKEVGGTEVKSSEEVLSKEEAASRATQGENPGEKAAQEN
jgi:small subunit ribosomal protein S3